MGVVIAKKVYEKPDEGQYLAVLADVADLGMQETGFGMKDRLALIWVLDAQNSEGYNFQVRQTFTKSLHENAMLTKAIKQITGVQPNVSEFDTEPLIGTTRILHIEHNANAKGDVFANVALIQRTKDVMEIPEGFVRQQDKAPTEPRRANKPTPQPAASAASSAPRTAAGPTRTVAASVTAGKTASTVRTAPATAPKPRAVAPAPVQVEEVVEEQPIDDSDIPF